MTEVIEVAETTNGGQQAIEYGIPYNVSVTVEGTADLILHRWNCDAIKAKAEGGKNSKAKKTDDLESYVYRDADGQICIPGTYLRGSIVNAARFRQDPRSPRKSAMDLFKAGVIVTTALAGLGVKKWDYVLPARVQVQRQGITRLRPAIKYGWRATFEILVLLPEYIDRGVLRETIEAAGRLVGFADFRPTYGRFGIVNYQ